MSLKRLKSINNIRSSVLSKSSSTVRSSIEDKNQKLPINTTVLPLDENKADSP